MLILRRNTHVCGKQHGGPTLNFCQSRIRQVGGPFLERHDTEADPRAANIDEEGT